VVSPGAALPGGDVEVQGANLGAVATTNGDKTRVGGAEWRRPIAMLGDLAAPVLLEPGGASDVARAGRSRIGAAAHSSKWSAEQCR